MMKFENSWKQISQIYFLTKHYLLIAEEMSDDFDTFLQPLKEHRDAFDHIVRVYGYQYMNEKLKDEEEYCAKNMSKALGHEYRAFFDTADWLSYICRQKIRLLLEGYSKEQIIEVYPKYDSLKEQLNTLPLQIAAIRENKDVSDDDQVLISEVEKYKKILDELIENYNILSTYFQR